MRISRNDLDVKVDELNAITGSPAQYFDDDGRAAVGHYHLDVCNGGTAVVRTVTNTGGEDTIIGRGTKRETYNCLCAFIDGVNAR